MCEKEEEKVSNGIQEVRKRRNTGGNILPFPPRAKDMCQRRAKREEETYCTEHGRRILADISKKNCQCRKGGG